MWCGAGTSGSTVPGFQDLQGAMGQFRVDLYQVTQHVSESTNHCRSGARHVTLGRHAVDIKAEDRAGGSHVRSRCPYGNGLPAVP